jgi:hypothetical protein
MRNDTQTRYARSFPPMTAAVADITLAACQRTFALNAAMLEQMLAQGINQSQQAVNDPRSTMTELQNPLAQPAVLEQMWRYSAAMMAICQSATASMANLITAQMRGADKEVESLSKEAHDEVSEAAASAAAAAGSVMSNGLAAVSRMTEIATQAGSAIGAEMQSQVQEAAATVASNGSSARGRAAQRSSARDH